MILCNIGEITNLYHAIMLESCTIMLIHLSTMMEGGTNLFKKIKKINNIKLTLHYFNFKTTYI